MSTNGLQLTVIHIRACALDPGDNINSASDGFIKKVELKKKCLVNIIDSVVTGVRLELYPSHVYLTVLSSCIVLHAKLKRFYRLKNRAKASSKKISTFASRPLELFADSSSL